MPLLEISDIFDCLSDFSTTISLSVALAICVTLLPTQEFITLFHHDMMISNI